MNQALGNYTCGEKYVKLSAYKKVHEGPNKGFIENMLHPSFFS